jgi:hypothetical protein
VNYGGVGTKRIINIESHNNRLEERIFNFVNDGGWRLPFPSDLAAMTIDLPPDVGVNSHN